MSNLIANVMLASSTSPYDIGDNRQGAIPQEISQPWITIKFH